MENCQKGSAELYIYGSEGFGRGSAKSYGKFEDELDNWQDTISWIGFKGPTNVRLESCNEIIQSFLEGRHIDPYTYHDDQTDIIMCPGPDMYNGLFGSKPRTSRSRPRHL